jgi:hypothetical protein
MPFLMLKQEVHEGLLETYHILLLSLGLQVLIDIVDQIEQIVPIVVAPFSIDLVDIEVASSILIIQSISLLSPFTFSPHLSDQVWPWNLKLARDACLAKTAGGRWIL